MKVKTLEEIIAIVAELRRAGKKVVFTNGCFDLIHVGHVRLLRDAKALGDVLIVGINSDNSMRQIKGTVRPLVSEHERAEILAALETVDYVLIFDEETPLSVIEKTRPDVLVKGADWGIEGIVGREIVRQDGGKVVALPLVEGFSTTTLIEKIIKSFEATKPKK